MDFDKHFWKQVSNNPIIFQAIRDDANLEIEDISHKLHKLNFKNKGKLNMFRVTGRFRLTWNDDDVI
jgi:hypothetical protein